MKNHFFKSRAFICIMKYCTIPFVDNLLVVDTRRAGLLAHDVGSHSSLQRFLGEATAFEGCVFSVGNDITV